MARSSPFSMLTSLDVFATCKEDVSDITSKLLNNFSYFLLTEVNQQCFMFHVLNSNCHILHL